MDYIYHLKPSYMEGKILLPLSLQEELYPKLYKKQLKMYADRPFTLNKKVPPLDCKWKDVLFFSCLNPKIIFAALELLGLLDEDVPDILQFPISTLKDGDFCFYQEELNKKEIFSKTSHSKYEEEKILPFETAKYFVDCVKKKENPLIFSGVKHLLYKGELDIGKAKSIKYTSLNKL